MLNINFQELTNCKKLMKFKGTLKNSWKKIENNKNKRTKFIILSLIKQTMTANSQNNLNFNNILNKLRMHQKMIQNNNKMNKYKLIKVKDK